MINLICIFTIREDISIMKFQSVVSAAVEPDSILVNRENTSKLKIISSVPGRKDHKITMQGIISIDFWVLLYCIPFLSHSNLLLFLKTSLH